MSQGHEEATQRAKAFGWTAYLLRGYWWFAAPSRAAAEIMWRERCIRARNRFSND
jgi:hypothetical protein